MAQHFYDGQIRRYITQIVRLLSNFSYEDGNGNLTQIPVMYGDITRQVAHILRDNSENKIMSAPRIGVYITGLELDRDRTSDSSFVSKLHIRERDYDEELGYLNTQGKNYTVERLMPTPYTLSINADIWTTNTEQKLQILEQLLMLFNPSLEIQTTDNYVDWTSLTVVNLDGMTYSSRTIPVGTDSDIDVATMSFTTPIYISPPVKVKKMGVITNIVMSIFDESSGTIDLGKSTPELEQYQDSATLETSTHFSEEAGVENQSVVRDTDAEVTTVTYQNYDLIVLGQEAQLAKAGQIGVLEWTALFDAMPGTFTGSAQLQVKRSDMESSVNGTVAVNPLDETKLSVNWDEDTFPTNSVIAGPVITGGNVDFIIDPEKYNPTGAKLAGLRLLILGDINNSDSVGDIAYTGPSAWKNADDSDFVAGANDIIEWDGTEWHVVFDASATEDVTYITNLNTSVQYKWTGEEWLLSFEGEYRNGTWRIVF